MATNTAKDINFLKGWQLLLVSDVFWWLKTVTSNQGSIDNQLPYTIAIILGLIGLILLITAVVVGLVNIFKKRRQHLGKVIVLTLLGIILLLLFGVA